MLYEIQRCELTNRVISIRLEQELFVDQKIMGFISDALIPAISENEIVEISIDTGDKKLTAEFSL